MTRDHRGVFLHIGLYKTGTTYLQNLWRANRAPLAKQGVYFPGGGDGPAQIFAVSDLFGRRPRGGGEERIEGRWQELTEAVAASSQPATLISDESLSLATVGEAKRAVAGFPDHEVHVIVTVRDLGRVMLSSWQQSIKSDETWTWNEFVAGLRDESRRNQNPGRAFWVRQDLLAVLETWRIAVPRDQIHVVTVPPSGSPKDLLVERVGKLVGFDHTQLTEPPSWDNRALSTADAEVLRRVNVLLEHRLTQRQHHHVVRRILTQELTRHGEAEHPVLSPDEHAWATAEAERITTGVTGAGYDVIGDLGDLVPAPAETGRRPDEASAEEMLDAALHGLATLAEEHAALWWERPEARPGAGESGSGQRPKLRSRLRATRFAIRRRLMSMADRHRVVAMPMNAYVRLRTARRRRAANRADN
jgi:hypothetical protein